MGHSNKARKFAAKFSKNSAGNFGAFFGLCLIPIITVVGAAYDYNQLSAADEKAQYISDAVAIAAAIYMQEHGVIPKQPEDGYVNGKEYSLSELGFDMNGYSVSETTVKVSYQEDTKAIVAETKGQIQPAFLQIIGKKNLQFAGISKSVYGSSGSKPTSVFLVLDNSGSMRFADKIDNVPTNDYNEQTSNNANAKPRLTGLKQTTADFMDKLDEIIQDQVPGDDRSLRTAMWPYSSAIKESLDVEPTWGIIADNQLNAMVADGGTNSYPAMLEAWDKIKVESVLHEQESGHSDVSKYVVFMTDGVNNQTGTKCETEYPDGHYHWQRFDDGTGQWEISEVDPANYEFSLDGSNGDPATEDVEAKEQTEEEKLEIEAKVAAVNANASALQDVADKAMASALAASSNYDAALANFNLATAALQDAQTAEAKAQAEYDDEGDEAKKALMAAMAVTDAAEAAYAKAKQNLIDAQAAAQAAKTAAYDAQAAANAAATEVQTAVQTVTAEYAWEKVWDPGNPVEVCRPVSTYDDQTLATCSSMKNSEVTIYTIGYSLEPGRYHRNDGKLYANSNYDRYHYVLDEYTSERAYALLEGCASSPEHFFRAEDADALSVVMEDIGDLIVKQEIRLTQ